MIVKNVYAVDKPEAVSIVPVFGGRCYVSLRQNIEAVASDDGTCYRYDEARFMAASADAPSKEQIEADFEAWWDYATDGGKPPTAEERIERLEEAVVNAGLDADGKIAQTLCESGKLDAAAVSKLAAGGKIAKSVAGKLAGLLRR